MTPERAEEIYYEAYAKASGEHRSGVSPLIQVELRRKAWESVIDAFNKESDSVWAERYLAMQDSLKTVNWQLKEGYLSPTPLVTET